MRCPECGHAIDLLNESQPVCPSGGADPLSTSRGSGLDLDEYGDVDFDDLTEQVKMKG